MVDNIDAIRNLVGDIQPEQLRDVECYIHKNVSLFLPVVGPCQYSLSTDHSHPAYLVTYSYDDLCRVQFGNKIIKTGSNMISVISPGVIHHEIVDDSFSRYVAVLIESGFWDRAALQYGIKETPVFEGDVFNPPENFFVLLREFISESGNNLPGKEDLLEAIGLRITHQIIRTIFTKEQTGAKISTRFDIELVIQFLNANYDQNITIARMASIMNCSASVFTRIFKQETGYSPNDFLIQIRLERARKLLVTTNKSVTEIAFSCGFNSSSHFSSSFLKKFKIQPGKYKVKIKTS